VTALRDYWRSLPHLEDPAGLTQMSETCDRVLAHLGSEPRVPVKHAWGYEVAAATADPIERAEALVPFLHIGGHRAREAAFNALAQCGAAGLPHFRAILQDEECHLHHYLAVKYFAKAGGRAAGPELTRLAADEAAFWKDNPHLPGASDWNALPGEVRARHAKLEQALLALNWLEYDGAVGVVADVRDHWKGLPRPWCLETGEIMQGCTAYLKKYAPERL